jgi:hypothetical protein
MKKNAVTISLATTLLLASFGASPAIAQEAEHDHQHQSTTAGAPEKKAKKETSKAAARPDKAASGEGMMDMKAMCDMHRQMMASGSQAEREAMADKEFKGMSAEQKHQHMKMMDEQCK